MSAHPNFRAASATKPRRVPRLSSQRQPLGPLLDRRQHRARQAAACSSSCSAKDRRPLDRCRLGQHGDLLDLIRLNKGHSDCAKHLTKRGCSCASRLRPQAHPLRRPGQAVPDRDTSAAARLYGLRARSRHARRDLSAWPRASPPASTGPPCAFIPPATTGPHEDAPLERWPALLGAVTDLAGKLTGLQRTWLARDGSGKAPIADPRRAMGRLLGNAVRFGEPAEVMAAGEGIETVLSLLSLFPALPMAAGLSAAHLAAILFPPGLRRLYVLRDNDAAGDFAEERLAQRCREAGIDCRVLKPAAKDLNADLRSRSSGREGEDARADGAGRPLRFRTLMAAPLLRVSPASPWLPILPSCVSLPEQSPPSRL